MDTLTWGLAAVIVNALVVGASLDQSIKQLPARRRIGPIAYSVYSRVADLANGVVWYAGLGIGAALITLGAAGIGLATAGASRAAAMQLVLMAAGTVGHMAVTAVAAPLYHRQKRVHDDEQQLEAIFNRFERLQVVRALLQTATLAMSVWALVRMSNAA
jgi:cytochrome bd-type quinol oxidase subunit 2